VVLSDKRGDNGSDNDGFDLKAKEFNTTITELKKVISDLRVGINQYVYMYIYIHV
jgi:hypothetical protein